MNRRFVCLFLFTACVTLIPFSSPAPLVYTPGEGWTYESAAGLGKWRRERAKDQLEVAQEAFDKNDYNLALKAARRVVKVWPLSDYAPRAQYLVGRSYEAKHNDDKAFNEYQKVVANYPKSESVKEVLQRQYDIGTRFLDGQRFKLWGYIPGFPSMDRTAGMFEKIVKSGPYSDVAPQAQLRIGAAREKQKNYPEAVTAYERAADRYHDRPIIAADAVYRAGVAYEKQALTAEYDQSAAGKALATFSDFLALYPDDARAPEAKKAMASLKTEQARGNFQIAQHYEKLARRNDGILKPASDSPWKGALIYYNEVLLQDPNSSYATQARQRIEAIKQRIQTQTASR
jgi:outer membrane protein assembly factor BamD